MKRKILSILAFSLCAAAISACSQEAGSMDAGNETAAEAGKDIAVADDGTDSKDNPDNDSETSDKPEADAGSNLIPAGSFDENNSHWGIYTESGGSANYSISGGQLKVAISNPGTKEHSVQIFCDGFELLEGGQYKMSFDVSSDTQRTIDWRIQVNGGDYHAYTEQKAVEIGTDVKQITCDFTMQEGSDPAPRLCFNIGDANGAQGLSKHEVYFDNVCLVLTDSSNASEVDMNTGEAGVNINQLGYRPGDTITAYVRDGNADTVFELYDARNNKKLCEGELTIGENKGSSGEKVATADLTSYIPQNTNGGKYYVRTANNGDSFEFTVQDNPYKEAFNAAAKMLYLQRCGMKLTEDYAGDFAHEACHSEMATIYGTNEQINVSGGWHDAGDYGRYSSAGAKAVADLLLAYETNSNAFGDNTGIPESGNNIPDILDEARYELDWLIKMQSDEGGVYHKVTGLNFDGVIMADECTEELYVLMPSKTATADFAAVMYMAARVYSAYDKDFSTACIKKAENAIAYYENHISDRNFTNPSDVLTGEYADGNSSDEYLWALCEGYKTLSSNTLTKANKNASSQTAKTLNRDALLGKIKSFNYDKLPQGIDLGWANMTGYAFYAYITGSDPKGELSATQTADEIKDLSLLATTDELTQNMKGLLIKKASELSGIAAAESYNCTIKDDYPWGSNMTIANNALIMLMADKLQPSADFRNYAKKQLDYLCGANTTSYCFITGYGTLTPKNPHHRPSQSLNKCMPGMLVGGPDSNLEDPFAKSVLPDKPNAHRYFDSAQTYSCNEVTIYWNSPLIYLISYYVN